MEITVYLLGIFLALSVFESIRRKNLEIKSVSRKLEKYIEEDLAIKRQIYEEICLLNHRDRQKA